MTFLRSLTQGNSSPNSIHLALLTHHFKRVGHPVSLLITATFSGPSESTSLFRVTLLICSLRWHLPAPPAMLQNRGLSPCSMAAPPTPGTVPGTGWALHTAVSTTFWEGLQMTCCNAKCHQVPAISNGGYDHLPLYRWKHLRPAQLPEEAVEEP